MTTTPGSSRTVVGLCLGSSFSSIALRNKEGHADCIANEDGDRQIANAIAYGPEEEYIGVAARQQLVRNAPNTIVGFCDLLGKSHADAASWTPPYGSAKVVEKSGAPAYSVAVNGEATTLAVNEVVAKFLAYMFGCASDFVGKKVDGAVIAVPAASSDTYREAIRAASERAGVQVLQFVDEAAAAFSAFEDLATSELSRAHRNVVVLDVGASSTTATVLAVRNGLATTLASERDSTVGGDRFDAVLIDWASKEYKKQSKQTLEPSDLRAMMKLRLAVEITKRTLSASATANCAVDSLSNGYDFSGTINRTRFDMFAKKVYDDIEAVVARALKSASLDVMQVDELILIGGTSKLPGVGSRLIDGLFAANGSLSISAGVDADEAVAKGAALQAERLREAGALANPEMGDNVRRAPALTKPIGLRLPGVDSLTVLLDASAALPNRRQAELIVGPAKGGSHALLSLWEGESSVSVSKPERNGKAPANGADDDDEDDEDEEVRSLVVKPTRQIVDLAVPVPADKKARVLVTLSVDAAGHGILVAKSGSQEVKASFGA